MSDAPAGYTQAHSDYLLELRDSGETNMWGAAPYIRAEFDLTKKEAKDYLMHWMRTFKEKI